MEKRLIAIHLPQFHPFKENDEWWGKGFTEWTNVTKAKPRFKGHYQPHLPTDTGFYDLRLPEARAMQADMARKYGIYGFCYYHYWFNGKRLMERPVDEILQSGEPDFPFMICWANENWSRNWDGGFSEMLIEQKYCKEDYESHMEFLCKKFFCDKRYITIDGKPFFVVYNPSLLPDVRECVETWRKTANQYGYQLYLGYMTRKNDDYLKDGFDCSIDFQPHIQKSMRTGVINQILDYKNSNILRRIFEKLFPNRDNLFNLNYDYGDYVDFICSQGKPHLKQYPGITPSWDNSPRRKGWFFMMKNSTPELYGKWLRHILNHFTPYSENENFVFINAWNEWAEGNHLEPDIKWGREYLEETLRCVSER